MRPGSKRGARSRACRRDNVAKRALRGGAAAAGLDASVPAEAGLVPPPAAARCPWPCMCAQTRRTTCQPRPTSGHREVFPKATGLQAAVTQHRVTYATRCDSREGDLRTKPAKPEADRGPSGTVSLTPLCGGSRQSHEETSGSGATAKPSRPESGGQLLAAPRPPPPAAPRRCHRPPRLCLPWRVSWKECGPPFRE